MKNNYKYIWNLFKNNKTDILLISFISLVIAIINIGIQTYLLASCIVLLSSSPIF